MPHVRDHGLSDTYASAPILVVEDDLALRMMLREILEAEGLTVEMAEDGEEALQRAAQHRPALVVLDMRLTDMGGETVAQSLHASGDSAPPILLVTGDTRDVEETARRLGAFGYITKPFEVDDLLTNVQAALSAV
jgi:CheY-like chemotaxis protein